MSVFDHYHSFISTSGGGGSGKSGGSGGCLIWILAGIAVLWVIGKLSG